ncbi:MAG: hypothetical protein ACK4WH_13475 [Phycisphaerales bacterium]
MHTPDPSHRPSTLARRISGWLCCAVVVGVLTPSLLAQAPPAESAQPAPMPPPSPEPELPEVNVQLRNGQRITGLLLDATREQITLRIAGISTRLPMDEVEKYDLLPPIMQRYAQLRDSIGDDPDQIVHLVEWLQAREKYALALTEAQRALAINPEHGAARRLKAVLEQQVLLRLKGRPQTPADPAAAPESANPPPPTRGEFPLLTPEQIRLIKIYEIDLRDKPRLNIPRSAVERMLAAYSGHPLVPVTREGREAILRKPPTEILDLMFRLQARDFYPQVDVIDQPRVMKVFRDDIQRTWLMSCATNACHGGTEAGRLILHNRAPNSEQSVYTNFLILNRFVIDRGFPLINWDNPERSPLLQYGLPRDDSLFPHPAVPRGASGHDAWKPEFRSVEDKQFKRAVEWIQSLYRPRPTYPINYTPLRPFEPEKPDPDQPPVVR